MAQMKIPGLGMYSDSEEEPERQATPAELFGIFFNKDIGCLEMKVRPPNASNAELKELMCIEELTEDEAATYGIELEESEVDWDLDHYIDCDLCGVQYKYSCRKHPLLRIPDKTVDAGVEGRASSTAPGIVKITKSKIPNAGLGVIALIYLPSGFVFGPYEGVILDDSTKAIVDGYCWEIRNKNERVFIDGSDENHSNWMRYINHATVESEQNAIAFQERGSVYYRISKPVEKEEEILVYYGESFNKTLTEGGPHMPFSSPSRKTRKQLPRKHPFIL